MSVVPTRRTVELAGHRVSYQEAGPPDGPPVVLLHGVASDGTTWQPAIDELADWGLRVLVPDLLGHGESAKPALDYTLDTFAEQLRDLLLLLGVPSATVAGHSLGGAIAMHFGYLYPDALQRLVLVSSGGLGREVHPLLRAATLPGADLVLRLAVNPQTARLYRSAWLHRRLRLSDGSVTNLSRAGRNLLTRDSRVAFFATLRSVVEPTGQRGNMIEMDYLAAHVPTLIVWSANDHVIPVRHAHAIHEHLPGSRLELLPGSSHEPHRRYAARFARLVAEFVTGAERSDQVSSADA